MANWTSEVCHNVGYTSVNNITTGTINNKYGYIVGIVREEKRILREKKLKRIYG